MESATRRFNLAGWGALALFLLPLAYGLAAQAGSDPDGAEGPDYLKQREEWFFRPRRIGVPQGTTAAALRLQARRQAQAMPRARTAVFSSVSSLVQSAAAPVLGTWAFLGPQPLTSSGIAFSGRGTCLAVDLVHDPTGNTVYYGSAYGGVWKTTNALGASPSFTPISDPTQSLAVGAIALDTSVNPPVIYVGTGEPNATADSYYGVGVLKSTDGGGTWSLVSTATDSNGAPLSFLGTAFSKILVDPSNHQILVAGTAGGLGLNGLNPLNPTFGLYRSTDGGNSWTRNASFAGSAVFDIVYDPSRSAYFAAVEGQGYFKSTDQGQSWTALSSPFAGGAAVNSSNFFRSSLALRNGTLYGVISNFNLLSQPSAQDTGLVQSADGGNTWTPIAIPVVSGTAPVSVLGVQMEYDQYVGAPPNATSLVIAGQSQVFTTSAVNGTSTAWTQIFPPHADHHAFFALDATHWYDVSDGGFFSTADSGADWASLNNTLGTIQFYSVSPDSQTAGLFAGGTQDNGTQTTTGSLAWTEVVGGDGIFTLADPLNGGQYFGEFQNGPIYRFSSTVGENTVVALPNAPFYTPYEMIPQVPSTLVAGPADVWMGPANPSTPGTGWRSISPSFIFVKYMAPAPSDPNVIYLTSGSSIEKTTNAFAASPTWTQINVDSLDLGPIAVNPVDANTVYVAQEGFQTGQKLFKTTDGGSTWTNISGNLPNAPMNWIAVDPQAPASVYVASDVGVFLASDGGVSGETWQNVGTGLPDTAILQIKISNTTPRQLVAATHGRGAWTINIGGTTGTQTPTATLNGTSTATATPALTLMATVTPSFTATRTATSSGPTATPTITPTPNTACGTSPVNLQLMEFTSLSGNQASENFEVINNGSTALNLSQVTLKFWIDDTTGQSVVGAVNFAGCNGPSCSTVSGVAINTVNFSPACGPDSTHQANWELTLSDTSAGTLAPGTSWNSIQTQIHLANFASFSSPADWYSPDSVGGGNTYTNDLHYALYYQGNLVTASGGVPPSCRAVATCTPGGSTATSTATPSQTPTRTFTATQVVTSTATSTATRTPSPSSTATAQATATSTATVTRTPTGALTSTPTSTATRTATSTSTGTATPSRTNTPSPAVTSTATSTPTRTPTTRITSTPSMTSTPTPSPTAGTGCGTSSLSLQLKEFGTCGSNQNQENFQVVNTGTSAVTFSDITIKFWADDITSGQALVGAVNFGGGFGSTNQAVNGVGISTLNFSPACGPDSTHQANWEITVSTTDTRTLGSGVTWSSIQTALHLANFANFSSPADWYSPCNVGGGSTYTNDLHYALYIKGNLVTASGGVPPSCRPVPTCTPGAPAQAAMAVQAETPVAGMGRDTGFSVAAAPNVSRNGEPIRFLVTLDHASQVTLDIYALTGERVYEAQAGGQAGMNVIEWNLQNLMGGPAASGLYVYRIEAENGVTGEAKTGRAVLIR